MTEPAPCNTIFKDFKSGEGVGLAQSDFLSLCPMFKPNFGAVFVPVTFTGISAPAKHAPITIAS